MEKNSDVCNRCFKSEELGESNALQHTFSQFFTDFSNKQIYKNVKEIVQKCLKSTIFVIILPKRIKHSGKQVKMFMLSTALIVRMVCDEAEV